MAGALYFDPSTKKVMSVPADESHIADQAGWVAVSQEQADKMAAGARAVREAGSTGNAIRSFGESAVKSGIDIATALPRAVSAGARLAGLTDRDELASMTGEGAIQAGSFTAGQLGGQSDVEAAAGARSLQQGMDLRASANPVASTAGALAGGVVGGLPLGAIGGAIKAGTAARLGGGMLARVAGGAAEGAAFGSTVGLSDAAAQAAKEGSELTGEQASSALIHGLVAGGLVGGGISGLGEALGAAKTRLGQVFSKGEAEGAKTPGTVAKIMGAASGKDPNVISEMLEHSDEGRAKRALAVFEGDSTRESAEREIRTNLDTIETATNKLTPEWRELKAQNVASTIDASPQAFRAQQQIAADQWGTINDRIEAMAADRDVYGAAGDIKRMQAAARVARKEIATAIKTNEPSEMYVALDDLKKSFGPIARKADRAQFATERETFTAAQEMYDGLKDALEHPTWGKAAEMQADVNSAFTDWMGTKKLFSQRFMTETGKEGWSKTYGADPGKVASYVRGLLDPAKDLDHGIIERHIASTKELAKALAGAGELTAQKQAELNAITASAEAFEKQIGTASQALSAVNKLDMLKGGAQHGIGISAIAGHAFGGPIGGTLGAVLGAAANPAAMVSRLAVMERLAGPMMQRGRDAMDALFAGVGKPIAGALEAGQALRVPAALSAFELFSGKHASPELAYPVRLQELAAAPQNIADKIGAVLGQDGITDPAAAVSAFTSANKAIQYLQAHIPVPLHDLKSLTPMSSQPSVSKSEIAEFAGLWSAVMRPRDVIAGIPHGTVSSSQMQAIQFVYPSMYQWLQREAMDRVQKADENGHQIPLRQKDILDTLFDLGDSAGPTYSIGFASKYGPRMGDKAQMGKAKPPTKATDSGKRLSTLTSAMLGG